MAAAGAAGAVILTGQQASAAPGDPLIVGQGNAASTSQTGLNSNSENATLILENLSDGFSFPAGPALRAEASGGTAVVAESGSGNAIIATADNGLAVLGSTSTGEAVRGVAFNGGTAVTAIGVAQSSVGLDVQGRAKFSRSGVATVPANASSVTVTGVSLTSGAYVLATLQQNRASRWVINAEPVPAYSAIVIRLNATVSAATKVAWFVIG
jgi:hypothetical protein